MKITTPTLTPDDINTLFVEFRKANSIGTQPSYLILGEDQYESMLTWGWNSYPSRSGIIEQRNPWHEDSNVKFLRLLRAGVFCLDDTVLQLNIRRDNIAYLQ